MRTSGLSWTVVYCSTHALIVGTSLYWPSYWFRGQLYKVSKQSVCWWWAHSPRVLLHLKPCTWNSMLFIDFLSSSLGFAPLWRISAYTYICSLYTVFALHYFIFIIIDDVLVAWRGTVEHFESFIMDLNVIDKNNLIFKVDPYEI